MKISDEQIKQGYLARTGSLMPDDQLAAFKRLAEKFGATEEDSYGNVKEVILAGLSEFEAGT